MYEELSKLKSELEKTKEENDYLRKEVDNAAESYQQQCIEINNLNVALDVMCRKYAKLRKRVGMDL